MSGLGGIAAGIGAGLSGWAKGVQIKSDLEDSQQRRALALEQNERDRSRFKMEEERMTEERARIAARKELSDGLSRISDLYSSGGGAFGEDQAQPAATVANPAAGDQPQPRMGLSVPGQPAPQPAAGGQPMPAATGIQAPAGQKPQSNPFMTGGENKYSNPTVAQDKYYAAKSRLLQDYYNRIGEPEKAMMVPKAMAELRKFEFEEKTGAALAGMAAGLPNAPAAFAKIYDLLDDGKKLDPSSGVFDQKTGSWSGLKVTDANGKTTEMSLSQGQIYALAKQKDAAALVQFNLDRSDKEFNKGMREREVRATERTASASETSAAASMLKAKTGADENDILRRSKIDSARVSAVNDMVQNTFKAPAKLDDLTVMSAKSGDKGAQAKVAEYETQMRAYEGRQSEVQKLRDRATTLLSLNPKLTASEAVAISKDGAKLKLQSDDNGDYVTYGGKKVYVN